MPPTFTFLEIKKLPVLDIHKYRPFMYLTNAELKKEVDLSRELHKKFKNKNRIVNLISQRILSELLKRN